MLVMVIQNKNGINYKCKRECKRTIVQNVWKKDYIWNPGICVCNCDKKCETDEYFNVYYV